MNLRKQIMRVLLATLVIPLVVSVISCSDTDTTDSTKFAIYYTGVTDIGPSMNFNMDPPTYKGTAPSDFSITQVTYENEPYNNESFIIDSNSGRVTINNTAALPVGMYRISIACMSNGNYYEFKDAIEVNMMAPAPKEITVEPSLVEIDFKDIKTDNKTAQVKTDGNHITILGYEVIQEAEKAYFSCDKSGVISINPKFEGEIPPEIYKVSLKLTTNAGKFIYEEAVTFNITSSPLEVKYDPAEGSIERNYAFESPIPTFKGSTENLVYSIKSITPANDKVTIDPSTGMISIAADNNFTVGDSYTVDITATNKYGSTDFDKVYTINVVAYIAPIEVFTYDNKDIAQYVQVKLTPNEDFTESMAKFEWVDLPSSLNGMLTLDAQTGVITSDKKAILPLGSYSITVKASNTKGEKTTTFTLRIIENENRFTSIVYGNNIGLTPVENYANQFRVHTENELHNLKISPVSTDAEVDLEWSIVSKYKMQDAEINANTGEITFQNVSWREPVNKKNYQAIIPGGLIMVSATAGKGTPEEFTLTVPVFINVAAPIEKEKDVNTLISTGVTIEYTPFVFKVKPSSGGMSVSPQITGAPDISSFLLDYRRNFNYWNIGANHKDGTPNIKAGSENFMGELWEKYYNGTNPPQATNTGSKDPMSYQSNAVPPIKFGKNLGLTLGYVDATDNLKVKINPNKWRDDNNVYANGIMLGQMTFTTDGDWSKVNNGAGAYPLFIWFDENFK